MEAVSQGAQGMEGVERMIVLEISSFQLECMLPFYATLRSYNWWDYRSQQAARLNTV